MSDYINVNGRLLTRQQIDHLDGLRQNTTGGVRFTTGAPVSPEEWQQDIDQMAAHYDRTNRSMQSHRRLVNIGRIASVAPFAAAFAPGGAFSSILSGAPAGAASAPASSGTSFLSTATAPTFGVPGSFGIPASGAATSAAGTAATVAPKVVANVSRLGSIFNSPGMELGVNTGLSLFGMRAQNKANAQARADALAAQNRAIDLELQQIKEARENRDLDRTEARELADREYALTQRQVQLQEEAAQYMRDRDTRDDARLAPYRAVSEQAMRRLASIWGLG